VIQASLFFLFCVARHVVLGFRRSLARSALRAETTTFDASAGNQSLALLDQSGLPFVLCYGGLSAVSLSYPWVSLSCCCCLRLQIVPEGGRSLPVMDVPGVMESGAQGTGDTSRGDRDGASEGSGAGGPGAIPARTGDRAGSTTSERGVPGDGGGDGGLFPFLPPQGEGSAGGTEFPSLTPQGQRGTDRRAFSSIPPQGAGGADGRAFASLHAQGVEGRAGGAFPPPPPRPPRERDQADPPLP